MSSHVNGKRIAKNTLMLYFRQILIMGITLYSVRIMLEVLGVEDYGIYSAVAGVVTMFSFLNGAMATASQRYFSFELGRGDENELKRIFNLTLFVYFFITLIIVFLAETIGIWFVVNKLTIPVDRIAAAQFLFHFSVYAFVAIIISTPYMAIIIAHEEMSIYAFISMIEVIVQLSILFLLKYLKFDKLALYGVLYFIIKVCVALTYIIISKCKFPETKFKLIWNKNKFIELLSYVGWNLFGSAAGVVRTHGINVIINVFFGPVVNAASSVAVQINSAIKNLGMNFSTAVKPQLIKSYASANYVQMTDLLIKSSRATFFLMYLFGLPVFMKMDFILGLWLKNPPESASVFAKIMLIDAIVDSVSFPLMTVAQATGKIKLYQSVVGSILLLNIPVSCFFIRLGCFPNAVFIVSLTLTFIAFIVRLIIIKNLLIFSIFDFVKKVVFPISLFVITTIVFAYAINNIFSKTYFSSVLYIITIIIFSGVIGLIILLNKNEKSVLYKKILSNQYRKL